MDAEQTTESFRRYADRFFGPAPKGCEFPQEERFASYFHAFWSGRYIAEKEIRKLEEEIKELEWRLAHARDACRRAEGELSLSRPWITNGCY